MTPAYLKLDETFVSGHEKEGRKDWLKDKTETSIHQSLIFNIISIDTEEFVGMKCYWKDEEWGRD